MNAVRIAPGLRMAVIGAPSYFARNPKPNTLHDLTAHNCINLRLTTHGGLYAWEFEKNGQKLNVRRQGQLAFNRSRLMLPAALAVFGLARVIGDAAQKHTDAGRLHCVIDD